MKPFCDIYVYVSRRADLNTLKSEMTKVKEEADAVVKQVCQRENYLYYTMNHHR